MKEKKELTKRELEERKQRRHVLVVRIVGFLVIAVMILTLCASMFSK